MYNSRVKNRKLKTILIKIINLTKFKTNNFDFNKKTILVSIIIWYISLFLNWIIIKDNNIINYFNSFNKITIFNSITIFIILTISLFILFSTKKKEKIKILTNFQINDNILLININFLIILLSISSIFTISWLNIFYKNINYWQWVILTIISWIFWIIASIRLKYKKNTKIIINESEDKNNIINNNNMKLPI